jgi:putative ABC transport system ATP-binding protein
MIRTENLTKIFHADEVETTALKDVNIGIETGEFVAIMGPSGCGKTTLLNILGLLDTPTVGEYLYKGINLSRYNDAQRTLHRKGRIGFIFQSYNLIEELTVFENVELPLAYLGVRYAERVKRVKEVLEKLRIAHRAKSFPGQLSGGQQQRVAIARAIVSSPELILADEPTGNLDSINGAEVMSILSELNNEGATIVMVTHSSTDADKANRIIQLFDGHVLSENFRKAI